MAMERITMGIVLAVAATGLLAGVLVSGLLVANRTVSNTGNVKTIGVEAYWDSTCTNRVSSIDWGLLEAGGSKAICIYVKNNGTAAETLSMATSNWNPSTSSSQISLIWNCTSYALAHESVVGALLTLSVSSTISGISSFSFDILITGAEST